MERIPVPTHPARLVNAVANIGYDAEVALCDLIDNSVDATASKIRVHFEKSVAEEDTDAITQYIIADDGSGMNQAALVNGFALGSERPYAHGSLGKFGLGLKSAGLALASTIVIVTKKEDMPKPVCGILSLPEVESRDQYEIEFGDAEGEHLALWEQYLSGHSRGTIVSLRDLNDNRPPLASFLDYFRRYCANVYHLFLEDQNKPLAIEIQGGNIAPIDPLFMDQAKANGPFPEPSKWDGKSVHLLLDDSQLALGDAVSCTVAATNLVHPPSFDLEGKQVEIREKYQIEADPYTGRPRHGFYIYRNRRIIVMAERFRRLVPAQTQAWAFRGRLMFDETADKILSLDVKKRHCELPKEARNLLKSKISVYTARSAEGWRAVGNRVKTQKGDNKEKFANESIGNSPAPSLDYSPGTILETADQVKQRQELQEHVAQESLAGITDPDVTKEDLDQRIRENTFVSKVKGLKGQAMWSAYPSTKLGKAETIVNELHSWVAIAYAAAEKDPAIAVLLHQLFTILARAELEVRTTPWADLPEKTVSLVLERFRRKASAIAEDMAESFEFELQNLEGDGSAEE